MKLSSMKTHSSSSTVVVAEALEHMLQRPIDPKTLRENFQSYFAELTRREIAEWPDSVATCERGLEALQASVSFGSDSYSTDVMLAAFDAPDSEVIVVQVFGTSETVAIPNQREAIADWIEAGYVEPRVAEAAQYVADRHGVLNSHSLMVAMAAGAECAPTRDWVAADGHVAAIMRANESRWLELFASASKNSVIYVPIKKSLLVDGHVPQSVEDIARVAGLDLVEDAGLVASFVGQVFRSTHYSTYLVAGFAYAPGAAHVVAQAVQDLVMHASMSRIPAKKLVLGWLGTPTDSLAMPLEVMEDRLTRYSLRSLPTRIRDRVFSLFGGLVAPDVEYAEWHHSKLSFINCSANMQGPNYLFAKRSQRQRAYVAAHHGVGTAYVVVPASRSDSVLDYKIIEATYSGAERCGVRPFEVVETQALAAVVFAYLIEEPVGKDPLDPTAIHFAFASHGGLWRLPYRPSSIWAAATVMGWRTWLRQKLARR